MAQAAAALQTINTGVPIDLVASSRSVIKSNIAITLEAARKVRQVLTSMKGQSCPQKEGMEIIQQL